MAGGTTIVGVFHDQEQARRAVAELRRQGFREDQIGLTTRRDGSNAAGDADDGNYAAEGAAAGVATGAGLGALWGLGILAGVLPAIGPAIAGGTLAVILSSAAAGAAAAGLAGTLIGLGMSKEEAEFYEGEFRAGRTIVTVRVNGNRSVAQEILQRFGAYDMSTRGQASALSGASASTSAMSSASASAMPARSTTTTAAHGKTVQAREEKIEVHKQPVQTGEVTVRKEVHTERKTLEVPVQREEVVVERHPVSGQRAAGTIGTGEEIRVPVTEEQVHIEKQPVVTEEVTVGKRKVQDTKRVDANVRKEEIKVEKKGSTDDVCGR